MRRPSIVVNSDPPRTAPWNGGVSRENTPSGFTPSKNFIDVVDSQGEAKPQAASRGAA